MTSMQRRGVVVACAMLGAASRSHAQAVAGVVMREDAATPLAGAIAMAIDSHGAAVGRALTNAHGRFLIPLSSAGAYSVRVLRIGFRPVGSPSVTITGTDTASIRIVVTSDAVRLSAMSVRERETCNVGADTGLVVARVWEEARKAMLSTQLASDEPPLSAEWIEYERTLDSTGTIVRSQQVRTSRHATSHAFRSLPAQVLDTEGYVTTDAADINYYAPDAEVLLSDAFVAGHCFQLAATNTAAPSLVGVSFQPAGDRATHHDIQGTLWLDAETAELRTLEFQYTNMAPLVSAAGAGGHVEFLRLAGGNWLVSRWTLRMPRTGDATDARAERARRLAIAGGGGMPARAPQVVRSIQVTGGEVTRIARRDSVVYAAAQTSLLVHLVTHDPHVHAARATLSLDGADYASTADARGDVLVEHVLPGRYHARVRTALMDSLELESVERDIDVRTGTDSIVMPSARQVLAEACPGAAGRDGQGMLHGGTADRRGLGIGHAAIEVSWYTGGSTGAASAIGVAEQRLGTSADVDGLWRVCGVPRDVPVTVRATTDSGIASAMVTLPADQPFMTLKLAVAPVAATNGRKGLLAFSVASTDGTPLGSVSLDVSAASGEERTAITSVDGKALLAGVPAGNIMIRARRIGFRAGEFTARVDPGTNALPIIMSAASNPMLDTVRIVAMRSLLVRHSEFDMRHSAHAAAASFNEDDIRERRPTDIWQMLTAVPSMIITDDSRGVSAVSTRTMDMFGKPCFMSIMIDGQLVQKVGSEINVDLRTLPAPEEIHGVEVFAGASTIPLQYGGVGDGKMCGLIAIWTR